MEAAAVPAGKREGTMNKWFVILVVIFLLFGGCAIVSYFAAPEVGTTTRYGMAIQATAAAATPDTAALLNQNRASLAEAEASSGGGAWIGFAIFLMVIISFGMVTAVLLAAPNTLKQGRLMLRTVGVSGRTRRPGQNPNRVRTIPNIPTMRQLPAPLPPEEGYDL